MTDQAKAPLHELSSATPRVIATWKNFQLWVKVWNDYNFPNKLPHQPLLGVFEECCGELWSALEQPFVHDGDVHDYYDAIGDTLVYLADYCNNIGMQLIECVQDFQPKPWDVQESTRALEALSIYCGKLCHAHLKTEQKIRNKEKHWADRFRAIGAIVFHLGRLPNLTQHPFQIAINTFTEVAKRDWIKYPDTGLPPIEPSTFEMGAVAEPQISVLQAIGTSLRVCCVCNVASDQLTVVGPGKYKCPACLNQAASKVGNNV